MFYKFTEMHLIFKIFPFLLSDWDLSLMSEFIKYVESYKENNCETEKSK